MRTGIFFDSFDPIHTGHIQYLISAKTRLDLDEVWLFPFGTVSRSKFAADDNDRWNMIVIAIDDYDWLYTKEHEIAAGKTEEPDLTKSINVLKNKYPEREFIVLPVEDTYKDVSSCVIRRNIARHLPITGLVPFKVEQYIREHCLYSDPGIDRLIEAISPSRWQHTLGVEKMANTLAARFNVDKEQACIAALYHDCAKSIRSSQELLSICSMGHIMLEEDEYNCVPVLHAPAGAVLAKTEYGINEKDIRDAIRWHTIGHPGMTQLEKVIYLADAIEEGRKDYPGLNEIRRIAEYDLDRAVIASAESTVRYLQSCGSAVTTNTLKMIRSLYECLDNKSQQIRR